MKRYVVIGHSDISEETTCWLFKAVNQKSIRTNLKGMGYVVYAILSNDKFGEVISYGTQYERMSCVKKMVSNYRYADKVYKYINDHSDAIAYLFNSYD